MVKSKEKSNVSLRRDPSWKYSVQVDVGDEKTFVYLKCNFSGKVVKGGVTRMKEHLSGSHKNVAPCANVPDKVKDEIAAYMKKSTTTKYLQQEQFDERVEQGAYYGSESGKGSSSTINNRGARGPMDHLRMYNSLVERCFNDCVDSFRRKTLDKQEETCVRRCAEKFLKHSMRVGMRFAELNQGAATQD
ncbi:hypothetical protein M5K25_006396 [Dendrobium thyrsiflorum]|uniref:BED-type domain-containing protein n=1 Tax=Dendrobium thyrsiflorum TaxID=117978 RepID=A0ABD0VB58_DENTH